MSKTNIHVSQDNSFTVRSQPVKCNGSKNNWIKSFEIQEKDCFSGKFFPVNEGFFPRSREKVNNLIALMVVVRVNSIDMLILTTKNNTTIERTDIKILLQND